MALTLILGLAMTAVALPVAGRRVWFLYRLITSGQPAPDRVENVTKRAGETVKTQLVEVLGQKKLLKWSVPGLAHFFVFWAFLILASVYLEAYGSLFHEGFHIPVVGHWSVLGFAQDFIAVMAFFGIVTFATIRLQNSPAKLGRRSRFKGSHLGGAWLVLLMIVNVIWSMFLFRGAGVNTGNFPYGRAAFMSHAVGKLLSGLSEDTNQVIEHVGLLIHIGVMLVFLILVLNSKHLHIFVAPLNVMFGRRPVALGAVVPMTSAGRPIDFEAVEDMDEDTVLGIGSIEDFKWKGMLDFASCTECGRCQSQCPAWNTEKPLSPKLLIMDLRDHAFAKAPYLLADSDEKRAALPGDVLTEAERPLIGDESVYGVIDPDVLWSCTSCGACVQQCPVDIEHVDHIVDMRRYQVLVESNFPPELNQLFKGLENKGNPWNMSATSRLDWAKDLPFDVKVIGGDAADDPQSLDDVEWLFWVGCAGAYEDRAKKTTRAVAELLDVAGVSFGVLGNGETCTGDPARRAGNEFVYQGLAAANVETFTEHKVKKVVSTCAHCFNTLKNEYKDFGIELEVVHHTQLLNRLVREGRLTPLGTGDGAAKRTITYHDPCYIGRHNGVYAPPRELLQVLPGAELVEMERNSERSFCCGAGGARMWMEENIGERINVNRTKEAIGTGADQIAVGCPFCRVMLSDGLTSEQAAGNAREQVEVLDVAQMLLASVKGEVATRVRKPAPAGKAPASADSTTSEATKAEPEAGDVTQTPGTVTATEDVGPAAKASGGSSLFDTPTTEPTPAEPKPTSLFDTPTTEPAAESAPKAAPPDPKPAPSSAGSLFDVPTTEPAAEPAPKTARPEPKPAPSSAGSLFDVPTTEPAAESAPKAAPPEPKPTPEVDAPVRSLFDIKADSGDRAAAEAKVEPKPVPANDPDTILDADDSPPEPEDKPKKEPGSLFDF